ncbi:hypothetical protein P88_00390 [Erwinia phage phiEt88]|uniref:hypothetical protein n=1 Tax=Erwinia phage phiEt88 TaxID=925984 RepID=UPI0001F1FC77|nr:hypothetical protein ErPhphiEt88_gp39 [Erwinia phage phiEt88]CBX44550.1 hypothetical protein P88_00390 [Erwinia phage phiEt88]
MYNPALINRARLAAASTHTLRLSSPRSASDFMLTTIVFSGLALAATRRGFLFSVYSLSLRPDSSVNHSPAAISTTLFFLSLWSLRLMNIIFGSTFNFSANCLPVIARPLN